MTYNVGPWHFLFRAFISLIIQVLTVMGCMILAERMKDMFYQLFTSKSKDVQV